MRFLSVLATCSLAFGAQSAPAASDGPVSLKDPKAFFALLTDMGYAPKDLEVSADSAHLIFTVDGFPSDMTLVGCKAGKDCDYLFLATSYSDILNPPAEWLAKTNEKFDLVKVKTNDRSQLQMSNAYMVEGLPRATFKRLIEYWNQDTAAVGDDAKAAGLTSTK